MQQNVQQVSRAIALGVVLVLAGAGAGMICFPIYSFMGAGIALGAGGLLCLGLLFLTCYRLDLPEGKAFDEAASAYFHALVPEAAQNPQAFASRIKRVTNQSTWYSALLFLSALEASAGIVAVALSYSGTIRPALYAVAGLVAILGILGRSLFVKIDDPDYPAEMIADAAAWPALNRILEEVRAALGARQIHRVVVVPGEGCSVSSTANRFGLGSRNTMEIGLYLPAVLSEDELRALFAHELNHISNKDTLIGFKSTLNRIRWKAMRDQAMEKSFITRVLFGGFAEYYYQTLTVHHAAVGKPHEFLADSRAVILVGSEAFASMLYKAHYLSEFMGDGVDFNKLKDASDIPADYYSADLARLTTETPEKKTDFDQRLREGTSGDFDTHPSFAERLSAAGATDFDYQVSLSPETPIRGELARRLPYYDELWNEHMLKEWESYQQEQADARQTVEKFNGALSDVDDCFEYAMALETLGRYEDALAFYDRMEQSEFASPVLTFRRGLCHLALEKDEGMELIRKAAEENPYLVEGAMDLVYGYLASRGRFEELEKSREWFEDKSEVLDRLNQEQGGISKGDTLLPVELDSDMKARLDEKFFALKRISNVYFLRKHVRLADMGPLFVGFETGIYDANKKDTAKVSEVIEEFLPELGFEGYAVYPYEGNVLLFTRTFLDISGARIYSRREYKKQS